jgi:hypothetical protein
MPAEDRFSVIAEIVRRMKQQKVAEFGDDPDESECDLMGFVACVRAGRQLFAIYHGAGPQAPRQAAAWSAMMLSCDEIFVIADSYFMEMKLDEGEGLLPKSIEVQEEEFYRNHPEVKPGFLQDAWLAGNRDGISEAILIQRYAIIGPPLQAQYSYTRTGRKLVWNKIHTVGADNIRGAIDDYVKEGFRRRKTIQPQINEMLAKVKASMAKEDFSPAEQAYWTDRGMAKFISTKRDVYLAHYMSQIPGMPDAVFSNGKELDPESYEEVDE